ncbi:MAG: hypothetical protein M0R73_05405 [Dehalococcoidia bacterium]|nr:hypothetical protein [Dehalococcoidia bacterium]
MGDMNRRVLLLAILALVVVVAAAALGCTSDGTGATATATVEAFPTGTSAPEATPTSTSTGTPTPTSEAGREPYHPGFTPGEVGRLPDGASLFVWEGCWACDGPPRALLRLDAGRDEPVAVWTNDGEAAPYAAGALIDGDTLYLFECTVGYCGNLGGSEDQPSAVTLHHSTDRGETWESLGEREGRSQDLAQWGLEASVPALDEGHQRGEFVLGDVLLDVRQLDDRGASPDDGPGYLMGQPAVGPRGAIAARWVVRDAENTRPLAYLTMFRADGTPLATFAGAVHGVAWLDESRLALSWLPEGVDEPVVGVLNAFAGVVDPLEAFRDIPGRNTVLGVIAE